MLALTAILKFQSRTRMTRSRSSSMGFSLGPMPCAYYPTPVSYFTTYSPSCSSYMPHTSYTSSMVPRKEYSRSKSVEVARRERQEGQEGRVGRELYREASREGREGGVGKRDQRKYIPRDVAECPKSPVNQYLEAVQAREVYRRREASASRERPCTRNTSASRERPGPREAYSPVTVHSTGYSPRDGQGSR